MLRAALVSDALDRLGLRAQSLGWDIVPLNGTGVLAGRAYTARAEPPAAPPAVRYRGLLAALDGIGAGEVFVLASGRSDTTAFWGDLCSTACLARGAVGAITDGLARDLVALRQLGDGFPVFARGTVPYDIHLRYEIVEHGSPVWIDGVEIAPGALLVADADGVVVVPPAAEEEVLRLVAAKAEGEDLFRAAVREGMAPSAAFERYGVL
jgi:4-hydroxy-4-methyl-2-oxoglutarate aldolase